MNSHYGFTIIEVLVSVVIINIVILGILKIQEQNSDAIFYIDKRVKEELSNSLFLKREALKYTQGTKKSAYFMVKTIPISKDKTRRVLKSIKRELRVDKSLPLEELPIKIYIQEIFLRGDYSSRYYRLSY